MTRPLRLMVLAPGHFHAALVLKEMLPEIHPRVYVYSPMDDDLIQFVSSVNGFNHRENHPAHWQLDIRAGSDFHERSLREQPGSVVVIAGRNRPKIDRILAASQNACHILADKPWIIRHEDFPKLLEVYRQCELREILISDMMTERHEITTILQRDLIHDPEILGEMEYGTPNSPMMELSSTHHLMKYVAGSPLRRTSWWYDRAEAGSALADISTHLVDLSLWMLFPDQNFDYTKDIELISACERSIPINLQQYTNSTGQSKFAKELTPQIRDGILHYAGAGEFNYSVRQRYIRVRTDWNYSSENHACEQHYAIVRGSRANIVIRTETQPELYIIPARPKLHSTVLEAVNKRVNHWQARYSGIVAADRGQEIHIQIPAKNRTDHEDHFAEIFDEFLRNTRNPRRALQSEMQTILAKYYITTSAAELAEKASRK